MYTLYNIKPYSVIVLTHPDHTVSILILAMLKWAFPPLPLFHYAFV